jgi:hypothetical protein
MEGWVLQEHWKNGVRNYARDPLFLEGMYADEGNLYVNDMISGVVVVCRWWR